MSVEITNLGPDCSPSPGTVIVREVSPGHADVRFIAKQGPLLVYSSDLACGDDLRQAVVWAVNWASRRSIDIIYVESEYR